MVLILESLDDCIPVDTGLTWGKTERLLQLRRCLSLDLIASFALGHEIDRIELVLVLAWHLWVLNHCLLRARFHLFELLLSDLGFHWWVVHLRFLLVGAVHSKKHLSDLVVTTKVLV